MEKNRSNRTISIILTILSILVMVLSTALYLQGRQVSKLKESQGSIEKVDRNILTETPQTEIKEKGISTAAGLNGEDEKRYKARIKKLYGDYAQSAKSILSESQMHKFEGYVNMQKSSLDSAISSSSVIVTRSAEKKDEE